MPEQSLIGLDGLDAILFDFDGTLVHLVIDFGVINRRVRALAVQVGADLSPYTGLYTLEFIERVTSDLASKDPSAAEGFFRDAHGIVIEEEVAAARKASPFPGVPELLAALRSGGVRVGIVTRNCRPAVEAILGNSPIPHDVLLTRDDVPKVKPDPDHLLRAAGLLGVSPERTLMVGDHPMDVVAGKAAGAKTVGILNAGRPADYFSEVAPFAVLRSVTEIPAHFASLCL